MGKLEGKVAVITGAASGIGEASAHRFAAEGAALLLADMNDARGEGVAACLRAGGAKATYVHADVSREDHVKAMIDAAVSQHGRLDVVFNNAGFGGTSGPIAEIPVDEFDATMGVLLRGVFLGIKHGAPILAAQGSGSIINTASVAGLRTGHAPHVYSVAKAAVVQLTKTVAMELGEQGVRVNCICPGGIATPLLAQAFATEGTAEADALALTRQALAFAQPLRRSGLPEDIAAAAVWLASEDAAFVNGHALVVDGGLTCGVQWSLQPPMMRERRTL